MPSPRVLRIARVGLTVADLSAMRAFYEAGLGFTSVSEETRAGPAFGALTGLEGASARAAVLQLSGVEIELLAFDPPGRPYPQLRAANDPWFQHFAVAVADMPAAYATLSEQAQAPISDGGPQLLPPSTGSVTAYKFRDPEGRPLELSYNPAETQAPLPGSPFLRVDHSAIAVRDLEAGVAFYTGVLGMRVEARLLNTGPTQARLDGLPDPQVDIVVLTPDPPVVEGRSGPHLELLHYRTPVSPAAPIAPQPNDLAATRLVLQVDDLDGMIARARETGAKVVSRAFVDRRALIRDPDRHLLELVQG